MMFFTALVNAVCWYLPAYVSADYQSPGIAIILVLAAYWGAAILLGVKGGATAWAEGIYSSADDLRRVERKWTIIGLVFAAFNVWSHVTFLFALSKAMVRVR